MAHWSEESKKLEIVLVKLDQLSKLVTTDHHAPNVWLFLLPFPRNNSDAVNSKDSFAKLAAYCEQLDESSTICFLTTPPDAALLLPYLEKSLKFHLWVAVKTTPDSYLTRAGDIPNRHAALLVLTKYRKSLRHTKTRIQYTYCPACGKTTKDYGGKKHTYHEYGTLLSDVWRDIEFNPSENVDAVVDRLSDLFGLEPYKRLNIVDLRACEELLPAETSEKAEKTSQTIQQRGPRLESQLINDDNLNALLSLPDNSIDFCFADPPYNLKKKYDKWDDALESVDYFAWCDKWLSELCRVLKPGRTLAVLNMPLLAVRHYQHLNSIMDFQAWIAWDGLSFPVRMVMPAHYAVLCFSKGRPRPLPGLSDNDGTHNGAVPLMPLAETYCLRANCISQRHRLVNSDRSVLSDLWHDVHRLKHNSRRVDHPCQLPPDLMRRLFALFTKTDELILDCFNGAGTSTLVAQHMDRRFIGIELSSQYHEITVQRHEQLTRGIDPFGKMDTVPTAKNSPVQRLPKQKYLVSKKTLQLEVKRIAHEIGHLPTREDVRQLSKYPLEYFDKYFVSWGEVCAAARTTGMSENPANSPHPDVEKQLSLYGSQKDIA
jgi:DNA modification methylase